MGVFNSQLERGPVIIHIRAPHRYRFSQVIQGDIDSGRVANTATVIAEDRHGTPAKGSGVHVLSLPRRPEISLGERFYLKCVLRAVARPCYTCQMKQMSKASSHSSCCRHINKLLSHNSLPSAGAVEKCIFTGSDANRAEVGDGIAYTFTVKNTGSTTVNDIEISSAFLDQSLVRCFVFSTKSVWAWLVF